MVNRNLLRQFDSQDEALLNSIDDIFNQEITSWVQSEEQDYEANKIVTGKVLDKFVVKVSYALGGFAGGEDDTRTGYLYDAFADEVVGQYKAEGSGGSKSSKKK